ncbi:hypothetical protein QQ045_022577 [Rhodiola kirilowii]
MKMVLPGFYSWSRVASDTPKRRRFHPLLHQTTRIVAGMDDLEAAICAAYQATK